MKWICLLMFGSVGLTAFVAGVVWGARRYSLYKDGVRAAGIVVEIEESLSTHTEGGRTRSSTAYYPLVEFKDAAGGVHRFRGSTGSSSASYEKGAAVDLVYLKDDPSVAQIADFEQFWLGPLAVGLFGFLFLAGGIGGFFLIADSDRTFGPEFEQTMARADLLEGKRGLPVSAHVVSVNARPGSGGKKGYVLVCRGFTPDGVERTFESLPLFFDPGTAVLGRTLTAYVDQSRPERYYLHTDPLFRPDAAP